MSNRTGAVLLGAAIVMATQGGPFASCAAAQDRTVLPVPIPDFAGKIDKTYKDFDARLDTCSATSSSQRGA